MGMTMIPLWVIEHISGRMCDEKFLMNLGKSKSIRAGSYRTDLYWHTDTGKELNVTFDRVRGLNPERASVTDGKDTWEVPINCVHPLARGRPLEGYFSDRDSLEWHEYPGIEARGLTNGKGNVNKEA